MAKKTKKPTFPILCKLAQGLFDAVNNMHGDELSAFVKEVESVSSANVWWAAYEVAKILKESATYAIAVEHAEKECITDGD